VEAEEAVAGPLPRAGLLRRVGAAERLPSGLLHREDVQSFFLDLPPQARLAIGDVHAFDDVAAWRPEPASVFHLVPALGGASDAPRPRCRRQNKAGSTHRLEMR